MSSLEGDDDEDTDSDADTISTLQSPVPEIDMTPVNIAPDHGTD